MTAIERCIAAWITASVDDDTAAAALAELAELKRKAEAFDFTMERLDVVVTECEGDSVEKSRLLSIVEMAELEAETDGK